MREVVSVIIPVYNVEPYLRRCVDSVLAQSYCQMEIILIDDGSTDGSSAVCDDYALKDRRIRVLHQENGGVASARNAGLGAVSGKYIFFIDSDDFMEADTLERLSGHAEGHDIVCCGSDRYSADGIFHQFTEKGDQDFDSRGAMDSMLFGHKVMSVLWGKLYRAALFEGISFPEGEIHEDESIIYLLIDRAESIYYLGEELYHYSIREGSITERKFSAANLARFEAYAKRAAYLKQKGYEKEYEYTIIRIIDEAYWAVKKDRSYRKQIMERIGTLSLSMRGFTEYPAAVLIKLRIKKLMAFHRL